MYVIVNVLSPETLIGWHFIEYIGNTMVMYLCILQGFIALEPCHSIAESNLLLSYCVCVCVLGDSA